MTTGVLSRIAMVALTSAVLSACGDGTSPDLEPLSVNEVLTELESIQDVSASASLLGGVPMPASTMPNASACTYNSTSQSFVCPPATATGVTFSRSYQLFDASNVLQSAFDPTTTNAIRVITDFGGTFTGGNPSGSVTIDAHDDYTISGLLSGIFTLNGSGDSEGTASSPAGTLAWTALTTITDLVLPHRANKNRFPQSGTIATELSFVSGGNRTDLDMAITFNGSSTATLVMTIQGLTTNCTIDLTRRNAAPVCG